MTTSIGAALFVSCLLLPLSCFAAEDPLLLSPPGGDERAVEEALKNCSANEIQIALCQWHDYAEAEREMETAAMALETALMEVSPDQAKLLGPSQDAFLHFRNATCAFDSGGGGTAAGGFFYGCLSEYVKLRTGAIKQYLDCLHGAGCAAPFLLYRY